MLKNERPRRLYSYIVRFDSGFAPNPFYGRCTLATCKPDIRRTAREHDWIIGCGSADKSVGRGGYLVYAMRVGETLTFADYWADARFQRKRPVRRGSMKQSCGDNIYFPQSGGWGQLDSFHSNSDGSQNADHTKRDTGTDRVLVADEYYYFGGHGPKIPSWKAQDGRSLVHTGVGRRIFEDQAIIDKVAHWCRSLGESGYIGAPWDWRTVRV